MPYATRYYGPNGPKRRARPSAASVRVTDTGLEITRDVPHRATRGGLSPEEYEARVLAEILPRAQDTQECRVLLSQQERIELGLELLRSCGLLVAVQSATDRVAPRSPRRRQ